MTEEQVGHDEFAAFRTEVRLRLAAIELQLQPLAAFLLARSGEQEKAQALEKRVYTLEVAHAQTSARVTRIWFGAAGVVALIEFIRLLPPGVVARLFGG